MTEDTAPQADSGLLAALQAAQQPAGAPASADVTAAVTEQPAPPSPPIQFADPPSPTVKTVEQALMERGLHPSQREQAPAPQPEPPRSIQAGDMRLVERGTEIVLESAFVPPPVHTPFPRNDRQMTRLEMELAAGQKRVAHHRAMQARRHEIAAKPSPAELAAQGHNTPVFRPGDVIESGRNQGGVVFPQTHVFDGKSSQ